MNKEHYFRRLPVGTIILDTLDCTVQEVVNYEVKKWLGTGKPKYDAITQVVSPRHKGANLSSVCLDSFHDTWHIKVDDIKLVDVNHWTCVLAWKNGYILMEESARDPSVGIQPGGMVFSTMGYTDINWPDRHIFGCEECFQEDNRGIEEVAWYVRSLVEKRLGRRFGR